jgi:hypothetical protein
MRGPAGPRVRSASRGRPVRVGCDRGRAARASVSNPRSGSFGARIGPGGRAGGRRVRSARLPACVGIPCDIATTAWPRRLIVSGFLTISSASVQRVHATLGIRGTAGRAGGACSCRGRLLGWGQVRVHSARLDGERRCGCCPSLGFVRQYHVLLPARAHSASSAPCPRASSARATSRRLRRPLRARTADRNRPRVARCLHRTWRDSFRAGGAAMAGEVSTRARTAPRSAV